jgi:hypothetical protein
MPETTGRIERIVSLVAGAVVGEQLKRAFFQLNDDLAQVTLGQLRSLGRPLDLPEERDRAALIAAAFSYRFDQLEEPSPLWLTGDDVVASRPVFLTSGLDALTRERTPQIVGRHNVWVDAKSFESV